MPSLRRALLFPLILVGLTAPGHASNSALTEQQSPAPAAARYGKLPLSFEANRGQTDPRIRFLARGAGYTVLLGKREANLLLSHPQNTGSVSPVVTARIRMRLLGVEANASLSQEHPLPGTVNYLLGNDPSKWQTQVPTFASVRYSGVYPGTDLVFYGRQGQLEFDFRLAAGADPGNIQLAFSGVGQHVRLDRDGNLVLGAGDSDFSFRKPSVYQLDAEGRRQPVEASFRLAAAHRVGFTIGRYDRRRPLIIDPVLNYSTYLGPSWGANAIAVDPAGNAYVAGQAGTGLPTTQGSFQPAFSTKIYPSSGSAFVAKINSTGSALLYCTYVGGNFDDDAYALAVSSSGNAFIAGQAASTDFPTTAGALQTANKAAKGAGFVTELNSTGTGLVYSTFLSGTTASKATALAVDSSANAFVTGYTSDTDFPVTPGVFQSANKTQGEATGFIAKLDPTGAHLLYASYLGGSTGEQPSGLALDAAGDAFIAGATASTDFPVTAGAFQTNRSLYNTASTGFVTKVNTSGSALVYSTLLGGRDLDFADAIAVDTSGNAFVTGYTQSPDFPVTSGVFQPTLHYTGPATGQNVFVTKLNPAGSALLYSTFLGGSKNVAGGSSNSIGAGIAVDAGGIAYITGETTDIDFPVTAGALQPQNAAQLVSFNGGSFLAKIDPHASSLLYATYLSGSGDLSGENCDCSRAIALDGSGDVYLAGETWSIDFPITPGVFGPTGPTNAGPSSFITQFSAAELSSLPATKTTVSSSSNPQAAQQPVTFTATVQSTSGSTPTGLVAFSVLIDDGDFGGNVFGPWTDVPLDASGTATFTTSQLMSGSVVVVAYYLGDPKNAPSSGSITQTINQIPTSTTIVTSSSPIAYAAPATFTATVLVAGTQTPAQGEVIFSSGTIAYAYVPLNSAGQATWSNGTGGPPLPVGSDTVTAAFDSFNAAYVYATSKASVTEVVTASGATPPPLFQPPAGTYTAAQIVNITDTASGALICYTTDGTTPAPGGSNPCLPAVSLELNASETVRAIATAPGDSASSVASAAYVINIPQPDFTIALNPSTVTSLNQTATASVSLTPVNGFAQSISFACSGLPAGGTCSFSPSTLVSNGSTTLTVTLPATTAGLRSPLRPTGGAIVSLAAILMGFLARRRRRLRSLLLIFGCTALAASLAACGKSASNAQGTSPSPSPAQTAVTVTATSGTLTHATTLTVLTN